MHNTLITVTINNCVHIYVNNMFSNNYAYYLKCAILFDKIY